MVPMTVKLSPSRISTFIECERCFWLEVNKGVKRPSGPFPSLPSGMDREIKNHFDYFRENGGKPPEIKDFNKDLELFEDREFLKKARSWRTDPKWKDSETGAVLRGAVDDLLTENGKIVVLDYKTRGYPPKQDKGVPHYYERQVNLYNLILRENGYETTDYGLILYFYPDRFTENGEFRFSTELRRSKVDVDKARGLVRDAVGALERPVPEHDEDCPYREWKPKELDGDMSVQTRL